MPYPRTGRSAFGADPFDHGDPIVSLSIVPMIVVLLVLCLSILRTIPVPNHALLIDLPIIGDYDGMLPSNTPPVIVRLTADGRMAIDGVALADIVVERQLTRIKAEPIAPLIVFVADGNAAYDTVLRELDRFRRAGLIDWRSFCLGGLADHADFVKVGGWSPNAVYLNVTLATQPPQETYDRPLEFVDISAGADWRACDVPPNAG